MLCKLLPAKYLQEKRESMRSSTTYVGQQVPQLVVQLFQSSDLANLLRDTPKFVARQVPAAASRTTFNATGMFGHSHGKC